MSEKSSTWIVTMHFGRGHVQTFKYQTKQEAQEAVRVAVFNNEDCINCSIYRQDRVVKEPVSAAAIIDKF